MDLVQTPANVRVFGPITYEWVQAGEAVPQGSPVYLDSATERHMLASAASAIEANVRGFSITPALADGDWFMLGKGNIIGVGATLAVGTPYILSINPGKIAPVGDLASAWFLTYLGYGKTADEFSIGINATGTQVP